MGHYIDKCITDIETVNGEAVTHNQRAVDAHPSDVTQFILWRSSQVVRYVLQPACNFWCARSAAARPANSPKPHQFYAQCVRRGHCDGYYTFEKFGVWVQAGNDATESQQCQCMAYAALFDGDLLGYKRGGCLEFDTEPHIIHALNEGNELMIDLLKRLIHSFEMSELRVYSARRGQGVSHVLLRT